MHRHLKRRGAASFGALLLLTQAAFAQAPPPTDAYERQIVSTASRKMLELQRETNACMLKAVPEFLKRVVAGYSTQKPVMYGAMIAAGKAMGGRGPASNSTFPTLYRVTSAESFFTYNVSDNWKKLTAKRLSKEIGKPITGTSPEVFVAWQDAVTNGQDIARDMLLPNSVALRALSWVSPDQRMVMATSSSREQGTDDFFRLCHLLSLAPEWYPSGFVNMNFQAIGTPLVRPVAFDGMASPLWVQHPLSEPAATGGGALEAFNKNEVRVSNTGPMQAYIVTEAMSAALAKSPSVNDYAPDLSKVAHGADKASQMLGSQQASIVKQAREARRVADAAFEREAPTPIPAVPQCGPQRVNKRALLPTDGRDGLVSEMAMWAADGRVEHRGQRFPAERFEKESERSPEAAQAIAVAATALLRSSNDPAVLTMVAQLGLETGYQPYYVTLLDRLDGRPRALPDGPGIRTLTVKGDLLLRLEDRLPSQDDALAKRAYALLKREQRPDIRLAMLIEEGSGAAVLSAFAQAARMPALDPWLAARAARAIAQRSPNRLAEAVAIAEKLPPVAQARFVEAARSVTGSAFAAR